MTVDRKGIRNERKEFINVKAIRRKVYKEHKYLLDASEISRGIKVILDAMESSCSEKIKTYSCAKKIEIQSPHIQIRRQGELFTYSSPLSHEQFIEKNYELDDALHDGNSQSKRGMNGGHWEFLVQKLLNVYALGQYNSQYRISSPTSKAYKKIDFMIRNTNGGRVYASLKQSVRERHRLASDEKSFVDKHIGDSPVYFLTTNRYNKLSDSVLDDLLENNLILVTDKDMLVNDYAGREGIISFEEFFKETVPKFVRS